MILNIPVDREEDGSNNNIINLKISFNFKINLDVFSSMSELSKK